MNPLRVTRCLRKSLASKPDVQKLLYGKRRNAVHSTSRGRPSAALLLTKVPDAQLGPAAKRALALQELSRDDVLAVLKSNRALRRLDRTTALVAALEEAKYPFTAHHYSLLMAHANDARDAATALQYWDKAVRSGNVNEKLHGALLATYRNMGKWEEATRHCATMWEDKLVVDPHALHAVLNACRRHGPWEAGLEVFSKAVKAGTKPNNVVYLELLRTIEHAKGMPARWKYALAILDALHGRIDVTAGHYNAVLATLGGPHMWSRGVELFESMKNHSVQPSRDTLNQLLLLNPANVAHCIRCVAEAHALGMPVTDTMYRAVLSNLFRLQLDHEASQFAEREYRRDVEDPGHTSTTTLALSFAMIDSLLAHPRPQDAMVLYESFESKLGDAVGPATRTLGILGQPSQRWLVQGRVAVVDHNIVLSTRMESLLHHYDSVFIPFSSVRLLVRRARQLGDSTQGRFTRFAFERLRRLLREKGWGQAAKVLPLSHQLLAHKYLVDGPTSPEALKLLRSEAPAGEGATLAHRLLASIAPEGDGKASPHAAPDAVAPLQIRTSAGDVPLLVPKAGAKRSTEERQPLRESGYALQEAHRLSSAERVLAVAAMLKSLSPAADVHVVSTNATQLAVVGKWTRGKPSVPITAVKFPDELLSKAPPPADPSEDRRAERSVGGADTDMSLDDLEAVIPSEGPARRTSFLMPS